MGVSAKVVRGYFDQLEDTMLGYRVAHLVLNDLEVAIEVKASSRVPDVALKHLSAVADDARVRRRIVVNLERRPREVEDRHGTIRLLPLQTFLEDLWAGTIVSPG